MINENFIQFWIAYQQINLMWAAGLVQYAWVLEVETRAKPMVAECISRRNGMLICKSNINMYTECTSNYFVMISTHG